MMGYIIMTNILETLFSFLDSQQLEAEARAIQATEEAFQPAEQRLTYDEFEEMWSAITEISSACQADSFTLGFRLGVQLTLEGLRPINSAESLSAPPCPPR